MSPIAGAAGGRGESLDLLADYVRSRLGSGDNTVQNAVHDCLRALKKAQWPGLAALLREVLEAASGDHWVQAFCLQALAERGQPEDLAAILDRFNDPARQRWCQGAILELARSGLLGPLAPALRSALGTEADPEVLGWMVRALHVAGAPDREPLSPAIVDRLPPSERMTVRWAEEGIDPERAAAILTEEGVLPAFPAASVLAEVKADWSKDRGAEAAVQRLFHEARIFVFYDEEDTGRPVADHTRLLRWLAEGSRGRFVPEALVQTPEPDSHDRESPVVIRFVHRGRARQIVARNLGDWFDTGAVVGAVNDLLESEGHAERFHRLPDGGQLRFFVFAARDGFLRAARRLHLPLWETR